MHMGFGVDECGWVWMLKSHVNKASAEILERFSKEEKLVVVAGAVVLDVRIRGKDVVFVCKRGKRLCQYSLLHEPKKLQPIPRGFFHVVINVKRSAAPEELLQAPATMGTNWHV